jgi:hypothetical protein
MSDQLPAPAPGFWLSLVQGGSVRKSIAKFIDTIGDQISLFLEPTHVRRKGKAQADVRVVDAKADAEIATVVLQNKIALRDIEDRADERVRRREAKRQANLEAIAAQAVKELPESVSEEPVDEDWVAHFLNHCQDVSNQQMQTIWARLLAGEVARPGAFSLRTLALVRVMDQDDADVFTRFCSTVWHTQDDLVPVVVREIGGRYNPGAQLSFMDLTRLDSLGLIRFESGHGVALFLESQNEWVYFGRKHLVSPPQQQNSESKYQLFTGNVILTQPGLELVSIAGASPNEEYRASTVEFLRRHGCVVVEDQPG